MDLPGSNGRGESALRAVVTDSVRRGVVVSPKGRWRRLCGGRNVNDLTSDGLADMAGQSTYHSTRVWLRRACVIFHRKVSCALFSRVAGESDAASACGRACCGREFESLDHLRNYSLLLKKSRCQLCRVAKWTMRDRTRSCVPCHVPYPSLPSFVEAATSPLVIESRVHKPDAQSRRIGCQGRIAEIRPSSR
jgi:hypothetical protein